MAEMNSSVQGVILDLVLVDLGKTANSPVPQITFLRNLIDVAAKEIKRKGITLDLSDAEHQMLIARYAAYLYRKRIVTGEESRMPRSLQLSINELLFSQKGNVDA